MEIFISVVGGGLITIATAFLIEYLRKPRLRITIEHPPLDRTDAASKHASRHLRLRLHDDVSPVFAPWMQRASAVQCRGAITFHHLNDGQDVFGRSMIVRWVNSPEPITGFALAGAGGVQVFAQSIQQVQPVFKFSLDSRMDVYAGEVELFDIAVRFQSEKDCYGWNNESYLHDWRTPQWKLQPGRYLVKAVITSSGQECTGIFRLVNDVESLDDFRLLESLPEDRWKVYSDLPPAE